MAAFGCNIHFSLKKTYVMRGENQIMNLLCCYSTATIHAFINTSPASPAKAFIGHLNFIHLLHEWVLVRGLASFSTSCRPGWLSLLHILKIAHVTSTHWPHQHFELLAFRHTPTMHNLLQTVEWSNQKFVGPGLQVFGLATPLLVFFQR